MQASHPIRHWLHTNCHVRRQIRRVHHAALVRQLALIAVLLPQGIAKNQHLRTNNQEPTKSRYSAKRCKLGRAYE